MHQAFNEIWGLQIIINSATSVLYYTDNALSSDNNIHLNETRYKYDVIAISLLEIAERSNYANVAEWLQSVDFIYIPKMIKNISK